MTDATAPTVTRHGGLAADDYGHTDGRAPLVLIHGYTFNRSMWRPAMSELERLDPGRRAIALDLPGHGDSPDAPSYSFSAVLAAVRAAVVDAGLEAPVIVGHSGGAGIAVMYAAAYPSRGVVTVDGSVMVAPFAQVLHDMRPALEGQGFEAAWAGMSRRVFGLDEVTPEVRAFVTEASKARQAVLLGYWQDLLDATPSEIQAWIDRTVAAIRDAGVPFVGVAGHDLSPAEAGWLASNFPEARTLVWPGSGHFPHLAHPREFAELVLETGTWTRQEGTGTTTLQPMSLPAASRP